jgi:hypothetical protein
VRRLGETEERRQATNSSREEEGEKMIPFGRSLRERMTKRERQRERE